MTRTTDQQPHSPHLAAQANAFIRKLLQGTRSDPLSLTIRCGSIVLAFGLLARAIVVHNLPAPLVLVPLFAEWLAILWLGPLLARTLIPCPVFGETARGLAQPVGWTLAVAVVLAFAFAWDPANGRPDASLAGPTAANALALAIDAGVHWAVLATLAGLFAASVHEAVDWKRREGPFFWGATLNSAFRMMAGLAVVPALVSALFVSDRELSAQLASFAMLPELISGASDGLQIPEASTDIDLDRVRAWMVFAGCLAIEVGGLAFAHWVQWRLRIVAARGELPPGVVMSPKS